MITSLWIENVTNPALLFFFLGILAVFLKSDLSIPEGSSKFISLYLLFSIGFKGGVELSHSEWEWDIAIVLFFGVLLAVLIPIYNFFILKPKLGLYNAAAIATSYGSVSAVTFVTAVSFLEIHQVSFGGHMVAVMALMEVPAIMVGVALLSRFKNEKTSDNAVSFRELIRHSFTNGSVLLILGSLLIGFLASDNQAQGISPFTTDIFKGFLAVFLLDMGISSGKKLTVFRKYGFFPFAFAIMAPFFNGTLIAYCSRFINVCPGDQFLFAILAASASYIAAPAAMKLAAPQANQGLYVPMALAITFPFNITIGMPWYMYVIETF